ncbi:hypothetical protein LAJ19_10720 [Deinococcus taeanensis]|uniref:hypothetical protein n=1 Tax=Deinococcus taeanensis TaxID=2737050 RepID=UPI001CDC9C26|nr:hypothetical protein [Deinococcus taeanensis]UBV42105.1 hypothetical protein LAJ19_10720 [Deinococcus taeanensis]
MSNQPKAKLHFLQLPVGIVKIPESKYLLTTAAGYIYFHLLSWVYHSGAPAYNNYNHEPTKIMAERYRLGQLGVLSSIDEIQRDTGYSKSTVELSLSRLESIDLIRKVPLGNVGTYFLMGSVDTTTKLERTFLMELAEQAAVPEAQARLATEFKRIFAPTKCTVHGQESNQVTARNSQAFSTALYLSEIDRLGLPPEFKHKDVLDEVQQCVSDLGGQHLGTLLETAASIYREYIRSEEAIHLLQDQPNAKPQLAMGAIRAVRERLKQVSAAARMRSEIQATACKRESAAPCLDVILKTSNIQLIGGKYPTETRE